MVRNKIVVLINVERNPGRTSARDFSLLEV